MKMITYQIEFFTFWHTSSGLSGGTYADLLVNKTKGNLPYLPGKTLKGLLRDAAECIHQLHPELVTSDFIIDVFGEDQQKKEKKKEVAREAKCFFSNGYLSKTLQEGINKEDSDFLYQVISSTQIDDSGQAVDHSLRQLEVTVPLTLYAEVEDFPNQDNYIKQLERCMKYTRKLGLNRSRGLGRCQFSIINNQ
jgi:CRISPR/Cas system CSM-associated protein Csm3 (group 7 of RAMP superfamily)